MVDAPETVITLLRHAYEGADHWLAAHQQQQRRLGAQWACQPECAWCCALVVEVTPLEALGIADYLQATYPAEEVAAVRERLRAEVARARHIPPKLRRVRQTFCGLLKDNRCLVYPMRPFACRGYISADADRCQAAYANRCATTVPMDWAAQEACNMHQLAFLLGSMQAGHPLELYEMQSAVLRALETPNAFERYLQGEAIFAGCLAWGSVREARAKRDMIQGMAQLVQLQMPPAQERTRG
jgi:hypothetical protein